MGHFLGAEKGNFLIRGDDAAMVHGGRACGNLSIRGPEVSLGSFRVGTRHVRKRRRRVRGRFDQWIQIKTGPQQCAEDYHDPPKFWIQSSLGSSKRRRMRCRRLPDLRPIPEGVQEPIYIRKK